MPSPELDEVVLRGRTVPEPKNCDHQRIQVPTGAMHVCHEPVIKTVRVYIMPSLTKSVYVSCNDVPASLSGIVGYVADGEDAHELHVMSKHVFELWLGLEVPHRIPVEFNI